MPTYIPTAVEMEQVQNAVAKYPPELDPSDAFEQRRLPVTKLIGDFDQISAGKGPDGITWEAIPTALAGCENSCLLAVAIGILRPQRDPNAAVEDFKAIRKELPDALAKRHTAAQQRRKILDAVVKYGAHPDRNWPLAVDVVYFHVYSGCVSAAAFLRGMIPRLNEVWGEPFEDSLRPHAARLLGWLRQPILLMGFESNWFLTVTNNAEGGQVTPGFWEVPPGARRSFQLGKGHARMTDGEDDGIEVPADSRLILRSFDDIVVELQRAQLVVRENAQFMTGPKLDIGPEAARSGRLIFTKKSDLEAWSCPCGGWSCNTRHRLASWDPRTSRPNTSLRTFLLTAVKGPGTEAVPVMPNSFAASMYYALLCTGTERPGLTPTLGMRS